jgi:hypothetical protein
VQLEGRCIGAPAAWDAGYTGAIMIVTARAGELDRVVGLDYGADDFDLPIEDEVTQKAGARIELDDRVLAVRDDDGDEPRAGRG